MSAAGLANVTNVLRRLAADSHPGAWAKITAPEARLLLDALAERDEVRTEAGRLRTMYGDTAERLAVIAEELRRYVVWMASANPNP